MSDPLVERLSRLDSCAVSDAMDRHGIPGALNDLHPLWSCPRVAGRVVTVKLKPAQPGESAHRHLGTAAIEASQPGDVIVVDNGGRTHAGSWGGILSVAAKVKGVAGVIADGCCRDVDEARDLEFPVWGRGGVPMTARARVIEESFNEPVEICGIRVQPGDLVIADWTGIVFLPAANAEEVIGTAEDIADREAQMARDVRAGKSVIEVMGTNYERMLQR